MGINIFSVSSYSSYSSYSSATVLPNPNPKNFKIIHSYFKGSSLAIEVLYPDCTNYEGRKILVFFGATLENIESQGSVDPHFCDNTEYYSPFARFEPTAFGWDCAKELVDRLDV